MKKNFIFSVLMLMAGLVASAQSIVVEDVTVRKNENACVNIVLRGAETYTAMGFTLELPENFTVASEMSDGMMNYAIVANNQFIDDHTMATFMKSSGNTMRVAVFSENNKPFKSNDDIIFTITVKTEGKPGNYQAKLKSLELANSSNNLITLPDVSFNIVVEGMIGDINKDGIVSVSDVTQQVNIILDIPTNDIDLDAADMNNDGDINVSDVTILVDKILNLNDVVPQTQDLCPDDNHPHMIDLGLPSGTKWACCNINALNPEGNGDYYAWGETYSKANYDWSTYIHCDGTEETCHNIGENIAGTAYDVAHMTWGGQWKMPTVEQAQELFNYCDNEWIEEKGIKGYKFTGQNGAGIFLPASGSRHNSDVINVGNQGLYWLGIVYDENSKARTIVFDKYTFSCEEVLSSSRMYGCNIRPVATENTLVPLQLSESNVEVFLGEEAFVEITSGNGSYIVVSSDESVASVLIDGNSVKVSAVGAGTATITVTDSSTGETATIEVTVTVPLCPDDNHPHMIDLGLPSGTLWACCNVDATTPEEYGGYFAWGETEEKDVYNSSTYIYYDGDTYYDIGSDISGTEYDVAHVKWGDSWVMPTRNQIEELCSNCSYTWASVNGIIGGKFIGPNGGIIFLPAAGERSNEGINDIDTYGLYWSSTNRMLLRSYNIFFDSSGGYYGEKKVYNGLTVRPVFSDNTIVPLQLSKNNVEMTVGEEGHVQIISGNGSYTIASSNENVATGTLDGISVMITAVGAGTTTITVTDSSTGETAAIEVTVAGIGAYLNCPDDHHPHLIDLGLPSGTKWACCNVGADTPESYGGYYAWGETEEKTDYSWSSYIHCDGSSETCHDLGGDIAGTEYDVAHVKWGSSWQMPTVDQITELFNNTTHEWTTVDGVDGCKIQSSNGGTLFFPAAGYRKGADTNLLGRYSIFWSSMPSSGDSSYRGSLGKNSVQYNGTIWRYYGQSIRPVAK